jgi:hypothetical protein
MSIDQADVNQPAQPAGASGTACQRALSLWRARRRLLAGALVAFAVLAVAPMLVPAGLIVPRVERLASEALQAPVRVGGARVFLLPLPHVTLKSIAIGSQPYLEVDSLSVAPGILSLFGDRKTLRSVEFRGVTARQPLFDRLERWTSGGAGAAVVEVQRVSVRGASLKLGNASLAGIDADLRLAAGNAVTSMAVSIDRGRVRLSLTPDGKGYAVKLAARQWRIPAAGLTVASLDAQGRLTTEGLELPAVEGTFYGGHLAGHLRITWQREWALAGQLELTDADLSPIAGVYSTRSAISGRLDAITRFDMRADGAAALAASPNIAVEFEVKDGVLHGVDLAAAARLLPGTEEVKPGDTRFDRFAGYLIVDTRGFHFTELRIASGALTAQGFVSISPKHEVSGRIDAAVKGTGSLVSTPLAVSGTVDSPRVLPTKGTVAGAAAGTLLLGPVVGTTIGMKAGQLTERLFGRKPPVPKKPVPQGSPGTTTQAPPPASPKSNAEDQAGRR